MLVAEVIFSALKRECGYNILIQRFSYSRFGSGEVSLIAGLVRNATVHGVNSSAENLTAE